MGLGTDLMLLAIDAQPGFLVVGPTLPYALVVAELVELAAAGRIMLRDERVEVLDRSPTGDKLTDDLLARLAEVGHGQSVEHWLGRQGRWRVEAYLAGLRDARVLRDSSAAVLGSGRIEIADTVRAAAPVNRFRTLIADESEPSSARDLAFAVLAEATGWPQTHLRGTAHRARRAHLKRLKELVIGAAEPAGYEGEAALAVLRRGVPAAEILAQRSVVSGDHGIDPARPGDRTGPMSRRGLRIVVDVVALLALATLVLACLTNVALAIVIAPFTIALAALPLIARAERHDHRPKTAKSAGDQRHDVSEQ